MNSDSRFWDEPVSDLHARGARDGASRPHGVGHPWLPRLGVSDHIRPSGFGNQLEPVVDV
jgi:hypothetical protein